MNAIHQNLTVERSPPNPIREGLQQLSYPLPTYPELIEPSQPL